MPTSPAKRPVDTRRVEGSCWARSGGPEGALAADGRAAGCADADALGGARLDGGSEHYSG